MILDEKCNEPLKLCFPFSTMLAARTRSSYSSFASSLYCNQNRDFNQIATAVVDAESWGEHVRLRSQLTEDFSIDDGDGSENVTSRTNSRFLKFCRVYFSSLKMSSDGRISLELISLGTVLKFKKRRKICRRLFTSPIKSEIRHFHVVVVQ